jgi:hypothetical protein
MEPKRRASDQDENTGWVNREWVTGSSSSGDTMQASPRRDFDDEEGQLGPDELSDPAEVVMNHEAKLHR